MKYKPLGKTDLRISQLGLGCANLDLADSAASRKLLEYGIDHGINFFDTARSYQSGRNEAYLGNILGPYWSKLIISTKIGNPSSLVGKALRKLQNAFHVDPHTIPGRDLIVRDLERSLIKLKTDHIDLLQIHNPAISEEVVNSIIHQIHSLKQQGKIRYFGISFLTLEDFKRSFDYEYDVAQIPLSMSTVTDFVASEKPKEKKEVGIIARRPFAEMKETEKLIESANKENPFAKVLKTLSKLSSVHCILVGTNNIEHLKNNIEAVEEAT